jgi:hypothetical protein
MINHLKIVVIAAMAWITAAIPSSADEMYIATFIGSQHLGDDTLNNINPGVTFGKRWASRSPKLEYHLEAGVFYNSYEEISPIGLAGISYEVLEIGPGAVRLGLSAGTAYYGELSRDLKEAYGLPNVKGFIPIAAATASYRVGNTEIRITSVPPGGDVAAIFNLSVSQAF